MPTITFDDVTKGQPLPMSALSVGTPDDLYVFGLLEGESSWNFDPVLGVNDLGMSRVLAYKLQAHAIVMFNNLGDMTAALADIEANANRFGIQLEGLGGYEERKMLVSFLNGTVNEAGVSWKVESVEHRPRLVIDCLGIASKDAFDAFVFVQTGANWS